MTKNESTSNQNFQKEIKSLKKKYASLEDDYNKLVDDLEENPYLGTPIGNDCYKIRLLIPPKIKANLVVQE